MGDGGKVKEDLSLVALVRDASVPVLRIQLKLDTVTKQKGSMWRSRSFTFNRKLVCVCVHVAAS